jgi:hypothetical protein
MTNLLGIIVFNAVLFCSLILSLPASALDSQEVESNCYEAVPAQAATAQQLANTASHQGTQESMACNSNAQRMAA